jgi:uncharacterized protein (TIGR00369 family)
MTGPAGKRPAESRTELAELMMPQHANVMGKVFGGVVLALIDKAAGTAAIRHASGICVTAALDQVTFHGPIEIGELVRLVAQVTAVGRTSMEVLVRVTSMSLRDGATRETNTCFVTMVAIDGAGKPMRVAPLLLESPEEHELERQARARMELRRAARA